MSGWPAVPKSAGSAQVVQQLLLWPDWFHSVGNEFYLILSKLIQIWYPKIGDDFKKENIKVWILHYVSEKKCPSGRTASEHPKNDLLEEDSILQCCPSFDATGAGTHLAFRAGRLKWEGGARGNQALSIFDKNT